MEARDAAVEQGARVVRNIRKWWPTLTDHDLRALNTWRWCVVLWLVRQVAGTRGTRWA